MKNLSRIDVFQRSLGVLNLKNKKKIHQKISFLWLLPSLIKDISGTAEMICNLISKGRWGHFGLKGNFRALPEKYLKIMWDFKNTGLCTKFNGSKCPKSYPKFKNGSF